MSSPAFFWRSLCGCRSHCGGRGCEELKRANTGVVYVFPIRTSKMQYEWYDLLSPVTKFQLCVWGFRLFIETNLLYHTLPLLESVHVCVCIYIYIFK